MTALELNHRPPWPLDFQKVRATPTSKKIKPETARCCLTLASSVSNRRAAHEDFGSSELMTPCRSHSVVASSVRPSASSASAVTWELSLVQGWVGESGLPECEGFGRSATENE